MNFTVFGASGFIGQNLVRFLRLKGYHVNTPARDLSLSTGELGHVIYAIGLTGDFRQRPLDTVEAHVCLLARLLERSTFESWLYLSSTRVYARVDKTVCASESTVITTFPDVDGLYDISKLLGEALCLSHPASSVRVARLSNVFGAGQGRETFLGAVLSDLKREGKVLIQESRTSGKDYVAIEDVVSLLETIALRGQTRMYNVASGRIVTHAALAQKVCDLKGGEVMFADCGPERSFPLVDISLARREFGFQPRSLLDSLQSLIATY